MSDHMKRYRCQTPWGIEKIYTDSFYLACKNVGQLHKFAEDLGLRRGTFFTDKLFPRYRLPEPSAALAVKRGAEVITGEELVKMFVDQKIRKPK